MKRSWVNYMVNELFKCTCGIPQLAKAVLRPLLEMFPRRHHGILILLLASNMILTHPPRVGQTDCLRRIFVLRKPCPQARREANIT